ncbi:MAG: hypothetical protein M0C28_26585 [Candidatus Moduliflexus flocculans]|nr:hypothetical protein [Candidatus Moduliflexus flocculans]
MPGPPREIRPMFDDHVRPRPGRPRPRPDVPPRPPPHGTRRIGHGDPAQTLLRARPARGLGDHPRFARRPVDPVDL